MGTVSTAPTIRPGTDFPKIHELLLDRPHRCAAVVSRNLGWPSHRMRMHKFSFFPCPTGSLGEAAILTMTSSISSFASGVPKYFAILEPGVTPATQRFATVLEQPPHITQSRSIVGSKTTSRPTHLSCFSWRTEPASVL